MKPVDLKVGMKVVLRIESDAVIYTIDWLDDGNINAKLVYQRQGGKTVFGGWVHYSLMLTPTAEQYESELKRLGGVITEKTV